MIYNIETTHEFCEILQQFENIYLAAAGTYGKLVGKYLNEKKIKWKGYLDKKIQLHNCIINGKQVDKYESMRYKTNAIVVICTIMTAYEIEKTITAINENCTIMRFDNRTLFGQMRYEMDNPSQEYINKLVELRGIGKKKRCFVIGTGSSLTIKDLEMLKDEFTFSVNSILYSFDKTEWRPTCYVAQDPAVYESLKEYGFERLIRECKFFLFSVRTGLLKETKEYDNVYFYNSLDRPFNDIPLFSDNVVDVVYESSTVIYDVLQFACYMGFEEIYLLGIDLGFSKVRDIDGEIITRREEVATASFLQNEDEPYPIYEEWKIIQGYRACKKYADENGLTIKNATRGGYLEVFDRVDFDSLFKE